MRSLWSLWIYLLGRIYNGIDDIQQYNRSQENLGFYPNDRLVYITLDKLSTGFQFISF